MTERESWNIFLRGFGLAAKRQPKPHICSLCGRRFYRRNQTETWERSPKGVLTKKIVKICTDCHTFGRRLHVVRKRSA